MSKLFVPFVWFALPGIKLENVNKMNFCTQLDCDDNEHANVCGIREEEGGVRLRLFQNVCELMKYGCEVEDKKAYGLINLEFCNKITSQDSQNDINERNLESACVATYCTPRETPAEICALQQDGQGFKVRKFPSECQLNKYNCVNKSNFTATDIFICNGIDVSEDTNRKVPESKLILTRRAPNVVVVDANMFNFNNNHNETINTFFAATHILDLPIDEMKSHVNETARRMLINVFGPQVVFKPWITIPKNISEDYYHMPTLSSCFHKCPKDCPDTYAPVCGQPGVVAREPSVMFQNHCYMDAAQCKMRWDDKSDTAESSCKSI